MKFGTKINALIIGSVLLCTIANAQKVTFKKDEYKIDKTTIATVEEKRSDNIVNKNFTILDMNKQPLITMVIKNISVINGFYTPTWYEVTFVPLQKTVTRPLAESPFGARKELLEEFAGLDIITSNGLNEDAVQKYMNRYKTDLAVTSKAYADSLQDLAAHSTHIVDRNKAAKIKVGYDRNIMQDGKLLGTWEKTGKDHDTRFYIKNDIKGLVAVLIYNSNLGSTPGYDMYIFFDGDSHLFYGKEAGISVNDIDTELVEKFVKFAINKNAM